MCIKTSPFDLLSCFLIHFHLTFLLFLPALWPFSPLDRQHVYFILRSPDHASSSVLSPSVPLTLPLVPLYILKWHLLATQAAGCLQLHSVIWSLPCLDGAHSLEWGGGQRERTHTQTTHTHTHTTNSLVILWEANLKENVVLRPMQVHFLSLFVPHAFLCSPLTYPVSTTTKSMTFHPFLR